MFYIPRYLWKTWEGGKLKMLAEGLQLYIFDDEDRKTRKEGLVTYLKMNLHNNNRYAIKFIICEILNFFNVVLQIFVTDS